VAAGQVLGMIAGGAIGNSLSHGRHRAASTVAGVIVGGVIGGELAR
jgi:uncharacterized protein YcfJ